MQEKITRVAIFGNSYQQKKCAYVADVAHFLESHGIQIAFEHTFATFIKNIRPHGLDAFSYPTFTCREDCLADIAISMGGDGTFLHTAAYIRDQNIPILGINTGHLGFLADIPEHNITPGLEALLAGHFTLESRSLIQASTEEMCINTYPFALNEVAILKHDNSSLITISTSINGEPLAEYVADGLIVCTPTGSTGYSLSAGGPIVSPNTNSFCLTAIAPHSLNVRPVVVSDDVHIDLKVNSRSGKFLLSIDGRSETLGEQITISLRRAPYTVQVVKVMHQNFFNTLREKMMWGMDSRDL